MRCASCSAEITEGHRFCGHCGTEVRDFANRTDAERRQVTVMFCDLVESMRLAAQLDPEDLRSLIRRYQEVVREVVERYDGHVAQYLGDGVLIYFGYPRAHEDDAQRAVRTGLEIVDALGRVMRDGEVPDGIELACRIGLHTGPVVAGDVGAGARIEQLALGLVPNIAARVQGVAGVGHVVVTEDSYRLSEHDFAWEPLGTRELKGVETPLALYRAMRPRRSDARIPTSRAGMTPFVGREAEIHLLRRSFDDACDGRGRAVLLRGGPGFGKSRLQYELRELVASEAPRWVDCECSPYHETSALYPIIEYAERALGFRADDSPEGKLAKLEAQISDAGLPLEDNAPLLAGLFSLPTERYERAVSNPDRDRRKTLELLVEIVRSWAKRGPVVLAIEDLHWADASTLEFLNLFVEQIENVGVLVLVSSRPGREFGWTDLEQSATVELERLGDDHARAIVDAATPLSPTLRREVIARADGVPLFVEELTRAMIARGFGREPGSEPAAPRDVPIPNTLRDSLMAQLDALGPSKDVAQLGAVLGRSFPYELLEAVSAVKGDPLRGHLQRVLDSGLLVVDRTATQESYEFKHALVHEAAYDSLLRARRRALHGEVATTLLDNPPAHAEHTPEVLARHCEGAGRTAEAAQFYEEVGTQAVARSANVEAVAAFRRALALLSDLNDEQERQQREKVLLPNLSAAISTAEGHTSPELPALHRRIREVKLAVGEGDDVLTLLNFWGFHAARGDRRETLAWTEEILEVAKRVPGPLTEAIASFIDGWTAFYIGDQPRAIEVLDRGLTLMGGALPDNLEGLGRMIFLASLNKAWALALAGNSDQAWSTVCTSLEHAEKLEEPFCIAQALGYQAGIAQDLGRDPQEIHDIAHRLVETATEYELGSYIPFGHTFRGWARAMLGDVDGLTEMREAIQASSDRGDRNSNGHSFALLAHACIACGRQDDAMDAAKACLETCAENLEANFEAEGYRIQAELLWNKENREAARISARRAIDIARRHGARILELRASTTWARIAPDEARAEALESLRKVYDAFEEGLDRPDLREAAAMVEKLAAASGAAGR